jgi:glycerate-2-kinase
VTPARTPRETLDTIFRAALEAVDPARAVKRAAVRSDAGLRLAGVEIPPDARFQVLAAGKAAAGMAAAFEEIAGPRIAGGLVVTKDGHGRSLSRLTLREAAHPVPDARSEAAGRALLAAAGEGDPRDVVVVLLSGGASSLLACPLAGLSRDDVAHTTSLLLGSGAAIGELNCVRKHLCDVVGGRLARAARGRTLVLLAISDVIGDALDVIGSGPCTPDPTRFEDARAVLRRRGLETRVPAAVRAHLEAGVRGERDESVKPGEPGLTRVHAAIVASNDEALQAAAAEAAHLGLSVLRLERPLQGEARVVGRRLGAIARAARPIASTLVLGGGETTVTLRGAGRGGRCQELALAAAIELAGTTGATLFAAGTDGTDGPTDAAGAVVDGETLARGAALRADAAHALACNDAHGFFSREGGLVRTGPTGTNVMDLVLLLLQGSGRAPFSGNAGTV